MERYICIHGHFYQPPRENPWLEAIELQDTAYPYHDWNERITAECYAPNAVSRILDGENRIVKLANNYAKISFNFGPTLLSWLEEKAPDVYQAILEADRESQKNFSGHGSALAQAYNHMILPLANRRDKYTQALWGIRDFERRFGRKPEGLWLPETAVDLETLDILAELGIRFTILAPHQARHARRIGGRNWRDVSGGRIDPTMAYEQRLPSGRKIALFFYDGPISRAVAFEGLLTKGENFANRLLGAFSEERDRPQLAHIATDGESYGHHHRFGDMALAYALNYIESNKLARLTNYGEYLEKVPPTYQVEIFEKTAWSCFHGLDRWWSDCGCNSGGHPGWNQAWRTPLRDAMDWLRDRLASPFEEKGRLFLKDPWGARDDYIKVILDRSPESVERFLGQHAAQELSAAEKVTVLKFLELQRHAILMYTSCGWFFDELSGIETVQVIQYAGRAVQLAQEIFGDAIESEFIERLGQAKSNLPEHQDGHHIYEKFVKPAAVDLLKVMAHYAVTSLFEAYPEKARIYCYLVEHEHHLASEAGRMKLLLGRAKATSQVTWESARLSFSALHLGDHNINGGVREFRGEEAYQTMVHEVVEDFARAEFPETIRLLDKHFGASTYSLRSLFRDEQRRVLHRILESTLSEAEAAYRQIFEHRAPLMRFLTESGIPLPKALHTAAEFVLNTNLRRALAEEEMDLDRIGAFLDGAIRRDIALDTTGLGYALQKNMERMAEQLSANPTDRPGLLKLDAAAALVPLLPFEVDLWRVQNIYYRMLQTVYPEVLIQAEQGDESAQAWTGQFRGLGEKLKVLVE